MNDIKNNLELAVKYFGDFVNSIEEYEYEHRDNKKKLEYLADILASEYPFNEDLMGMLYKLYDYKDHIKSSL